MNDQDKELTEKIMAENRLESDARTAVELLREYSTLVAKMQDFIKSAGGQPQDPVNFCRTMILAYGMKKLESKIVTLQ